MSTKKLGNLERVPLRKAWVHEASDFTPWLAEEENLNKLADKLGLSELELVATEHWVGDFKLDILCTDGEDQVIIENQIEKTNHTHLGQLIAYAAGVGAKKVIWVAESFRPEHSAALQFLNENTNEGLSFFAVEVELYQIDDSAYAPNFLPVVKPNDWAKSGREQARAASSSSPTKALQQKFWIALIDKLSSKAPQLRPQKARMQHWLSNSIGRSGFGLHTTANTKDRRIGVELWIPGTDAKKHFANLQKFKNEIEAKLGFPLEWQELPDALGSRVISYYSDAPLEDESRWTEYMDWITDRLVKMNQVLRPIVRSLP